VPSVTHRRSRATLPTAWHQAPVLDLHETDHPNPQLHDPQFRLTGRTHRGMRVRFKRRRTCRIDCPALPVIPRVSRSVADVCSLNRDHGSLMPAHCGANLSSAPSIRSRSCRCPGAEVSKDDKFHLRPGTGVFPAVSRAHSWRRPGPQRLKARS
jgi:hypothetical protein